MLATGQVQGPLLHGLFIFCKIFSGCWDFQPNLVPQYNTIDNEIQHIQVLTLKQVVLTNSKRFYVFYVQFACKLALQNGGARVATVKTNCSHQLQPPRWSIAGTTAATQPFQHVAENTAAVQPLTHVLADELQSLQCATASFQTVQPLQHVVQLHPQLQCTNFSLCGSCNTTVAACCFTCSCSSTFAARWCIATCFSNASIAVHCGNYSGNMYHVDGAAYQPLLHDAADAVQQCKHVAAVRCCTCITTVATLCCSCICSATIVAHCCSPNILA